MDSLTGNAQPVSDRLEEAQFGTYEVLFAALDYNYSWKIYEARQLRDEFDGIDGVEQALDGGDLGPGALRPGPGAPQDAVLPV